MKNAIQLNNALANAKIAFAVLSVCLLPYMLVAVGLAEVRDPRVQERVLDLIASKGFTDDPNDRRCHEEGSYRVFLIDNFDQQIRLVPELMTTHGEMMLKLLQSGRRDMDVVLHNTDLGKGLAKVIDALSANDCADAVVTSIPGSNYTYDQINSLFPDREPITAENLLSWRYELAQLMRTIAFEGFPSVEWMERVDVNTVKLKNDAIKFVLIEALGRLQVPVFLPYGNIDATHKGKIREINLLSLAENAQVFTALNQAGERISDFPYSPLSSGDARAIYDIVECPHPYDRDKAHLDINNDGFFDYTFPKGGSRVPHGGDVAHPDDVDLETECIERGTIVGTSLIPPHKAKEMLPPKKKFNDDLI